MSELSVENSAFHPSLFEGATVCLLEDDEVETDLFPLTVLRPVWDLLAGTGTILEHVRQASGAMPLLRPREHLRKRCTELWPEVRDEAPAFGDIVFLNGRLFELRPERQNDFAAMPTTVVDDAGRLLLARRPVTEANRLLKEPGNRLASLLVQEGEVAALPTGWRTGLARQVWDVVLANSELLRTQLGAQGDEFLGARPLRDPGAGVEVCSRRGGATIFVGSGVKIHPGVVLGNHAGPIYIGAGSEIMPHSYLEGPLFVASNCVVSAGTRLRGGCSFGPLCKLGGEITQTIVQGYSNKQHEGFLGHAHVGQWVNLGAGTTNSNLKNNYSEVKVRVGDRLMETGHQHIGCFIGDHAKTAIGTVLNTGTVIGIGCNLFDAGFPPRFVPSFHWGGAELPVPVPLGRVLETARLMMARRGKTLTETEEELMHRHYEIVIRSEKEKMG